MNRKILLSSVARKKLNNLLHFLETEWSLKAKADFIDILDKRLNQISRFPESCPKSIEQPGLHKCVVTSQTSVYYLVRDGKIEIVTLFDNRQDPSTKK